MGNYRILRLARVIAYIAVVLNALYWLWFFMALGVSDFGTFVLNLISAAAAIVSNIALIQLITLALKLNQASADAQRELSQHRKMLREMQTEMALLKWTVEELGGPVAKPASSVSTPAPPSTVQVRARVRLNDTLLSSPGGDAVLDTNGLPLKVLEGQGVYLTARSADARWYKFSLNSKISGWLAADSLKIADMALVDHLPVDG
ncbi:MAG: hypothetical protein MUF38_08855 [Anaerolineae bacterium]|jgi:hypothetical protein|nr:hypothetical protein [Anaerolineae bacterium]